MTDSQQTKKTDPENELVNGRTDYKGTPPSLLSMRIIKGQQ
jgi:hypothetical protein